MQPTCAQLAPFADAIEAGEEETKLKEFAHLNEIRSGVFDIRQDWRYKRNLALIRPKLKEMTLSDQAFAVAEINRIVWEALKPNLIFRELVNIFHTTHPTFRFIRAILIPRAFDVAEGTEIRSGGEKYDNIDVTVRKIGIRPLITREMVEDAVWDVVARQLAEAGRAMAQKENEIGLALLNTLGTSGNNYQGYGLTGASATPGTLAYTDLVAAIAGIRGANAFPDTLAIHPTEEGNLLNDDKFIHMFYFGGLMKKASGPPDFFGQPLGIRVLTSTLMTHGTSLVLDTARAAGMVIRRDVTVENLIDPVKDLSGAAFTERFNLGVLRANAIYAVTSD